MVRVYRVIGAVGRTLIAAGVLILLFVVYQLWGTGIQEARAQDDLRESFLQTTTTTSALAPPPPAGSPTTTTSTTPPPPVPQGEAVAIIRIPKIGVDKAVVSGVSVADLKKGPGHYPNTPMPGQPGNAAIAGHRTTYGAPFFDLDKLVNGDEILVTTRQGEFRFEVDRILIVAPTAMEVLDPTPEARLTLTTCNPKYSARERLIVSAVLVGDEAPSPPTTTSTIAGPGAGDDDREPSTTIAADPFDQDVAGLSGESVSKVPAILWGSLAALVWLLSWAVGHRWRRWKWPAYLVGTPVFLVVLFVFFENFSRFLPANI